MNSKKTKQEEVSELLKHRTEVNGAINALTPLFEKLSPEVRTDVFYDLADIFEIEPPEDEDDDDLPDTLFDRRLEKIQGLAKMFQPDNAPPDWVAFDTPQQESGLVIVTLDKPVNSKTTDEEVEKLIESVRKHIDAARKGSGA